MKLSNCIAIAAVAGALLLPTLGAEANISEAPAPTLLAQADSVEEEFEWPTPMTLELKREDIQQLKALADTGDAEAQYQIGTLFCADSGYPKNAKLALKYLQAAVAQDHPDALFILGCLYMTGNEVLKQDIVTGRVLLEKAAALGSTDAAEILEASEKDE